jgi:DNA repair photolyase
VEREREEREAGFLAEVRAGARAVVPPRVFVTTVKPRLLADLVVLVDTRPVAAPVAVPAVPPIALRTYVRYRSAMALRWRLAEQEAAEEKGRTLFPDERVAERHVGKGAYAGLEFLHVNARTIINAVPEASAVPFRFTINPYRGCSHACVYCFARPTHDYLGLGIGEDFERKIVVKVNAVERLRAELRAPAWGGDAIAMGTNTDPYQHAEGKYHLTRGIVETLCAARNPFSILTKSTLILRDAALLAGAFERTDVSVSFSIGTLDRSVWRLTEPGTPPPDRRVEALRRLNAMGIPCGVLVAPVLPGLSDSDEQLRAVVEACAEAGAVSITGVALHLRGPMREHWFDWLARARPDLVRLHRARFRRGAYQEDVERERVEEVVRDAARRCGVTGRERYRARPESAVGGPARTNGGLRTHAGAGETADQAGGQQLRLL